MQCHYCSDQKCVTEPYIDYYRESSLHASEAVLVLSVFDFVISCNRLWGAEAQCTAEMYFLVSLAVSCEF